jgi:hypothetical protein
MTVTHPEPAQSIAALMRTGTLYLPEATHFFTDDEWRTIESIAASPALPWEKVLIGDADEPNDVHVGRFMTDIDAPRIVNAPLSEQLLPILASEKVRAYCQRALGMAPLYLRRAQLNRMGPGSFIGKHLDCDSNPDYEISLVLQLGTDYQGGAFVVHGAEGGSRTFMTEYRSVLITRCTQPHEVLPVLGGSRTTLVFFLSRENGLNSRTRANAASSV